MKNIKNKERILELVEIFELYTDEENQLSLEDLRKYLENTYGPNFNVSDKTLRDDLETLNNVGYEIVINQDKYGKKYYSRQTRLFELYELRLLIDAICSARFIGQKDSKRLIEKIKKLTSKNLAKKLDNQIYIDERNLYDYKGLRYNIDSLHRAINKACIVKFQYGKFDIDKEFVYSREKGFYTVKPYGMVWNNGFYYFVGFNIERDKIVNYRVDRMRNISLTGETFRKEYFNLGEHVEKCFNMFPGPVRFVKMKFNKKLLNAIIDRFGRCADIKELDNEYFTLETQVAITEGLVRWILTWGSDAQVLYPESLKEKVEAEIKLMYEML